MESSESDVHPSSLTPETPSIVQSLFSFAQLFISQYGWFLLAAVFISSFLWSHLRSRWESYLRRRQEHQYYSDPDLISSRQTMLESTRRTWQEKYDVAAEEKARKIKEREEQKRQEQLVDWERHQQGQGYRSRYRPDKEGSATSTRTEKTKAELRPSFNPLAGDSSGPSCSFRPGRRSGS